LNTLHDLSRYRHEAKNSKFDAVVGSVASSEEAMTFIKENSNDKVNHNCWAYRLRDGYCRASDDGEPGGTAGKPILDALEKGEVHDAVCVVTRFYGGVKLGMGGLQRAYRAAAAGAVEHATLQEIHPMSHVAVHVLPTQIGSFYKGLSMMDQTLVKKLQESTSPKGEQLITLRLSAKNLLVLERECADLQVKLLPQED
jgi:putative IMPACT (imprinted ancient) family translation regulator